MPIPPQHLTLEYKRLDQPEEAEPILKEVPSFLHAKKLNAQLLLEVLAHFQLIGKLRTARILHLVQAAPYAKVRAVKAAPFATWKYLSEAQGVLIAKVIGDYGSESRAYVTFDPRGSARTILIGALASQGWRGEIKSCQLWVLGYCVATEKDLPEFQKEAGDAKP